MSAPSDAVSDGTAARVALVQMPFGRVEAPSLALSLLKAALARRGIAAAVHYANIAWAEQFGFDVFRFVEHTGTTKLVGEWIFAGPDGEGEPPALPEGALAATNPVILGLLKANHPLLDPSALLRELRRRAGEFVARTAAQLVAKGPKVVAASSTFQQHCASVSLLRRVKELSPETVTMIGGANCDGDMGLETSRRYPWIDYVFCGEADESFPAVCERALRGETADRGSVVFPSGAVQRASQGTTCAPGLTADLDALPIPDFDDYFRQLRASAVAPFVQPSLVLEGSRGCWWGQKHHCSFCGLLASSIRYRFKRPERLAAELAEVTERYGVRKVQMTDNIAEPRIAERLLPEIRRRCGELSLFFETRANLSRGELEALAAGGVRRIQPGLESLHDGVLALIDKGTTAANNLRLLRDAENLGVDVVWNVLFGFPGEEDEWYAEVASWLPSIGHLRPPIGLSPVRFDRFSPHWQRPADFGLRLEALPSYREVYGDVVGTGDLAYFFHDRSGSAPFAFGPDALSASWWARMKEERPGLSRFYSAASDWIRRYWSDARPRLVATDHGSRFTVVDTRSSPSGEEREVSGLSYQVLAHCHGDVSRSSLPRKLGAKAEGVEAAIARLLDERLLLEVGSRLVSLPLVEPVTPVPPPRELPGGEVDDPGAFSFFASRSVAGELAATSRQDFMELFRILLDRPE